MPIEPVQPMQLSDVWNPMQSVAPMAQLAGMAQHQESLDQHKRALDIDQQRTDQQGKHFANEERIKVLSEQVQHGDLFQSWNANNELAKMQGLPSMGPDEWITAKGVVQEAVRQKNDGDTDGMQASMQKLMQVAPNYAAKLSATFQQQSQARAGAYAARESGLINQNTSPQDAAAVSEAVGSSKELLNTTIKHALENPLTQAKIDKINQELFLNKGKFDLLERETQHDSNLRGPLDQINRNVMARMQEKSGLTNLPGDEQTSYPSVDKAYQQHITPEERARMGALVAPMTQRIDGYSTDIEKIKQQMSIAKPQDQQAMASQLSGLELLREREEARKAYVENPIKRTYDAWQEKEKAVDRTRTDLTRSSESLQQQKFSYTQSKDAQKTAGEQATNDAMAKFMALPKPQQTPAMAARLAREAGPGVSPRTVYESIKELNPSLVTINNKQETAESQKVGEGFGTEYADLQKSAITATNQLSKLDRMEQLLQGVQTGKLAPAMTQIQALGDSLGFKVDPSLGAKQALEAMSNEIALTLRNPAGGAGMPGALSDKDREFLSSMTPGLGKTNEGNALIIKTAKALNQRSQVVAKMARDYRKQHGHFDEGFYDELQAYSDAHPLFAGQVMPKESASPSVLPYSDPDKERRYQEWKRSQGK
jgi:hypothetical protein